MPFITELNKHARDIVPAGAGGTVDSNGGSCQPDFQEGSEHLTLDQPSDHKHGCYCLPVFQISISFPL